MSSKRRFQQPWALPLVGVSKDDGFIIADEWTTR